MSQENVEICKRSFERFIEGRPEWELYADDFQYVNLPDAPWQPSPGVKGLQEWLDFTNEVTTEWGADLAEIEVLDSERVLISGTLLGEVSGHGHSRRDHVCASRHRRRRQDHAGRDLIHPG